MRLALETLLKDLQGHLKTFGIHTVEKNEIELAVDDPEMLRHAKLPFFDSKNADGFSSLSGDDQTQITSTMVDANQHEFSKNVGIALWNAAVRALYIHDNPIKAGLNKANKAYVDSQYLYMDNDRKTKSSEVDGVEVEKLYSPTNTPRIVDQKTFEMAKSYLQFINVIVNDQHALDELEKNIGFTGKTALSIKGITIDQIKDEIVRKAKATQAELKNRIAAFEARLNYNSQSNEDRKREYKRVTAFVEEATQLNNKALNKFDPYYKIEREINRANRDIVVNSSAMSYNLKIERVNSQIQELDRLIDSFPPEDSIQIAIDELGVKQSQLLKTPLFQLPENYLLTVANDLQSSNSYTLDDQITRADEKIQQIFEQHIEGLKYFKARREKELQELKELKDALSSLLPVLEELNRVSNVISRNTQLINPSAPEIDLSEATTAELIIHNKDLQSTLREIDHVLGQLEAQPAENFSAREAYNQGLQSLDLMNIIKKLQSERESCHDQLQTVAAQIRKKELEEAHGNTEALVKLKQEADSLAGIHSHTLRNIQTEKMRLVSYVRIAQESIEVIEKKYSADIAKAEAQVKKKSQFIAEHEIHQGDAVISSTEKLEALKAQLLEAKATFKKTGIPVSEAQFQQLKLLLNWDEELTNSWSYIKDQSTTGWISRGISRATSSISLTDMPEKSLSIAIEDQLKAVDLSLARKQSLQKSQTQLEQLHSAMKKESAPYLSQKQDAESKIKAAATDLEITQDEIDTQKEIIRDANQAVERSFLTLATKLNGLELNRANLAEIKKEFTQLTKATGSVFDIKHMPAFRDFKTLYEAKELALSKAEQQAASEKPNAPAALMAEVVAAPAPKSSLFNKYFSIDEHNEGLANKYLAQRAATYVTFDKLDYAFTQGLKFFSCGAGKAKTDQQARVDYLASIAEALEINTEESIAAAYTLIEDVLNDPKRFPARATVGSVAYKKSMRALLVDMKTDLEARYPDLANKEAIVASAHF